MVAASIVHYPGKVELREVEESSPGVPLLYLKLARFSKPMYWTKMDFGGPLEAVGINHIVLRCYKLGGCSVPFAYWPENWDPKWGLTEVLKWEDVNLNIWYEDHYDTFQKENQCATEVVRHDFQRSNVIQLAGG